MSLNRNFTSSGQTPAPTGLKASGDFYDFKDSLLSRVTINLVNTARQITRYTIQVRSVQTNVPTPFNVIHLIKNGDIATDKKLEVDIIKSPNSYSDLEENNIEYTFNNLDTYQILHLIEIKELVGGVTRTYNLTYTQSFRYYSTPVTLSDFTFTREASSDDHFQNGDNLQISGLLLDHGANSPIDTINPETITLESGITIEPIVITIQEDVLSLSGSDVPEYFYYERAYTSSGIYTIPNIQLTLGKIYKVTANASWALGYSTSKESTQKLSVLNRPKVTAVDIKPLHEHDVNNDVVDITIEQITSATLNQVAKIWFEFCNTSDVIVAKAGGVTGFNINLTSNLYTLKLADIAIVSNGGILNDGNYKVKALIQYATGQYRRSVSFPELASEYKNFTKSVPTIVSHTINSLYTSNPNGKILDVVVKEQAYQLYAPNVANGIKFHFYDAANTTTIVASTSSYTFSNISGGGNVSYSILLSDVTPAVLVNDNDYRIKAEVTLVKHNGDTETRTSALSAATESVPDKVNFAENLPTIVGHTINPLYTSDPTEKILDISVKKQAYQLYAPIVSSGIKFHFYDGAALVASTSSYTFLNSAGVGNESYSILLSDITPAVLIHNDYRIKAEVTLVNHGGNSETRSSLLSAATESIPDNVIFNLKKPVINSLTSYDLQVDTEGESNEQIIADIVVAKELYELVAPNSASGIRFLLFDSTETTLIASSIPYTFQNSSSSATAEYSIRLNHLTIEAGQDALSNGIVYKVKAEVTIVEHSGSVELRLSEAFTELSGSQSVAPITSVNISNHWALATNNNPSSSPARFNSSPDIGISGYFKKTPQFNGGATTKHLDTNDTEFKIEYSVDGGVWTNVKKAVLLQKSSGETLFEAVSRVSASTPVSSPNGNGQYPNVVGSGLGQDQENMIFFIPQEQVTGVNAFTELNSVKIRITIIDSGNIWQSEDGGISQYRESSSLQLINKINKYDFVNGSASEPWNSLDGSNLLLNIPVDWKSIHADSVKVGVKYASGDSYSYQTFTHPTSLVQINVNPNSGTTLYYSVAYIVDNVNLGSTATTEGLSIEKSVSNKFFPSSSDYSVANTSYKTFNTGGKSSITFDLAFNAASTSVIHGVNVYFASPDSSQGSNITKTRIGSYPLSSEGGNALSIQLLYYGGSSSTINSYGSSDNNTPLNTLTSGGLITSSAATKWGDFDLANITFEAYRDSRVVSTNASYGSTYYVESGSSDFGKTIWNVPVLNSPSGSGSVSLIGGVRNSSTATKLSWPQISTSNGGNLTYDLTMMKNDVSSPLIHNDVGLNALTANEKTLLIDTGANAKYNITLASVFQPNTPGSMREVSATPDTIEFHTIHVDVSGINVSVNYPSTTSKVNLSFGDAVVSGNSVTSGALGSASFVNNIVEQHVIYSTTNPTNALTRLAPAESNVIERIVAPDALKEYTLPVTSPATKYSFFMRLKALIKYKLNSSLANALSVVISDQTATSANSEYIVSSIPIIGTTFTTTPDPVDGTPVMNLLLNANGLEEEGFISVVIIIGQDGTPEKVEGESVILVFPDTGATSDYSNNLAGSGVGNPRLAAGESSTATPRSLTGAVMGTHGSPSPSYTLTIGDINSTTGRYNNSTLKMPPTSVSGFSDGPINMWIMATTRRGTDFSGLTATHSPPVVVSNVTITGSGSNFYINFDLNDS